MADGGWDCARCCGCAGSGCCSAPGSSARSATACSSPGSRRSCCSPRAPADTGQGRDRVRDPAAALLADRSLRGGAHRPVASALGAPGRANLLRAAVGRGPRARRRPRPRRPAARGLRCSPSWASTASSSPRSRPASRTWSPAATSSPATPWRRRRARSRRSSAGSADCCCGRRPAAATPARWSCSPGGARRTSSPGWSRRACAPDELGPDAGTAGESVRSIVRGHGRRRTPPGGAASGGPRHRARGRAPRDLRGRGAAHAAAGARDAAPGRHRDGASPRSGVTRLAAGAGALLGAVVHAPAVASRSVRCRGRSGALVVGVTLGAIGVAHAEPHRVLVAVCSSASPVRP